MQMLDSINYLKMIDLIDVFYLKIYYTAFQAVKNITDLACIQSDNAELPYVLCCSVNASQWVRLIDLIPGNYYLLI